MVPRFQAIEVPRRRLVKPSRFPAPRAAKPSSDLRRLGTFTRSTARRPGLEAARGPTRRNYLAVLVPRRLGRLETNPAHAAWSLVAKVGRSPGDLEPSASRRRLRLGPLVEQGPRDQGPRAAQSPSRPGPSSAWAPWSQAVEATINRGAEASWRLETLISGPRYDLAREGMKLA